MNKEKAVEIEVKLIAEYPQDIQEIRNAIGSHMTISELLEGINDENIENIPVFDASGRRRLEMYLSQLKMDAGVMDFGSKKGGFRF